MSVRGGLDWAGLMRVGLHQLRLRPAEFWALTPAELAIMLGESASDVRAMGRSRFEALLARFPDGADRSERKNG